MIIADTSIIIMELCSVCSSLSLGLKHERQALGPYDEILSKSKSLGEGRGGCGGCAFFCTILHGSNSWSYRLEKLPGHFVFFGSLRLDVKKTGNTTSTSWSVDDLLFDLCTDIGKPGV